MKKTPIASSETLPLNDFIAAYAEAGLFGFLTVLETANGFQVSHRAPRASGFEVIIDRDFETAVRKVLRYLPQDKAPCYEDDDEDPFDIL